MGEKTEIKEEIKRGDQKGIKDTIINNTMNGLAIKMSSGEYLYKKKNQPLRSKRMVFYWHFQALLWWEV